MKLHLQFGERLPRAWGRIHSRAVWNPGPNQCWQGDGDGAARSWQPTSTRRVSFAMIRGGHIDVTRACARCRCQRLATWPTG
uniref:Uncharacterized protein n=1 Tax=Macrostomum lignano TaxID=282301 RepID=A0A1I8JR92_9PLAT